MTGITEIQKIFDKTYENLKEISFWTRLVNRTYNFTVAAQQYRTSLDERYNNIRIMGMLQSVKLNDVYTRVNVLSKITGLQKVSIEELERYYNRDRRVFETRSKTQEGIKVVNKIPRIVLLGKPGAGKTTFLKHIVLRAADGSLDVKRVPVFISLKGWSDSNKNLMEFIVEQFDICQFPDPKLFIERMLLLGKCILLLDGLDEISAEREKDIIKQVYDFSNKYQKNQFIISCRIAAYKYLFHDFTEIELADFNDEQIKSFINNWFGQNTKKAQLCWKAMENNPPIKELSCVPLLLTLLCLNFEDTMKFPENKAELYEKGIDALLSKWDSFRNIERQEIYQNLALKRKTNMLSSIAVTTFEKGQYFIPQQNLKKYIAEFILNLSGTKEEDLEVYSEAIIKSVEAQHGIFVERAQNIYSFSHLTFQEYFAARHIVDNIDEKTLENLVDNHIADDRWQEVFLLTAGMLPKADKLLSLMIGKSNLFIDAQLRNFLNIISTNLELDEVIKRELLGAGFTILLPSNIIISLKIYFTFKLIYYCNWNIASSDITKNPILGLARNLINDLNLTRTLNLSYDLVLILASTHNCNSDLSRVLTNMRDLAITKRIFHYITKNKDKVFSDKYYKNFYDVQTTNKSLAHDLLLALCLTKAHTLINNMNCYLKGNLLVLECINRDCYISKDVRKKIITELLGTIPCTST